MSANAPTSPGSRAFAKLILAGDFTGAVEVARAAGANGAQIIDVNMDEAMLDSKAAMVKLPEPHRLRARHRACAGDDRLVQMGSDRGGLEVRAGQAHRQFDFAEGRRRAVPAPGEARAPLWRRGRRDGVRREGAGRHVRAQDADLPPLLRPAAWTRSAFRPKTSSSIRTCSPSPPASRSTTTTPSISSMRRAGSASTCRTRRSPAASPT